MSHTSYSKDGLPTDIPRTCKNCQKWVHIPHLRKHTGTCTLVNKETFPTDKCESFVYKVWND